ncbi:DHH family phosphoesterase [Roseimarinus sediminis]|uniref:DHH family phosphoesterase n=1 Tax=Roseimarinus sediminis TaxID=1610899 RepID=UPI003D1A3873
MNTSIDPKQVSRFKQLIGESQKAVIVPHINPDGDAIGSCLACRHLLTAMGKTATVVIPNEYPDFLQWIDGSSEVIDFERETQRAQAVMKAVDTLFVLDFNNFERSEGMADELNGFEGRSILIDHHPGPVAVCDLLISYPEVNSTCELFFRLVEAAGFLAYIGRNAAEAIFTGMMTDTGNFSYNASDPETYRIIAKLLEKGIDKDQVHSNVYHTFSEDRWRLIGHSLKDKMVILPEYRTGYISLSREEMERFNYQPGDTEGLVNYPLMVKDIVFCIFFYEKDDVVKVSLRSKGAFSVNQFSREHFNGGGHNNAAGGRSELSLNEAIDYFLKVLPAYRDQLLASS